MPRANRVSRPISLSDPEGDHHRLVVVAIPDAVNVGHARHHDDIAPAEQLDIADSRKRSISSFTEEFR